MQISGRPENGPIYRGYSDRMNHAFISYIRSIWGQLKEFSPKSMGQARGALEQRIGEENVSALLEHLDLRNTHTDGVTYAYVQEVASTFIAIDDDRVIRESFAREAGLKLAGVHLGVDDIVRHIEETSGNVTDAIEIKIVPLEEFSLSQSYEVPEVGQTYFLKYRPTDRYVRHMGTHFNAEELSDIIEHNCRFTQRYIELLPELISNAEIGVGPEPVLMGDWYYFAVHFPSVVKGNVAGWLLLKMDKMLRRRKRYSTSERAVRTELSDTEEQLSKVAVEARERVGITKGKMAIARYRIDHLHETGLDIPDVVFSRRLGEISDQINETEIERLTRLPIVGIQTVDHLRSVGILAKRQYDALRRNTQMLEFHNRTLRGLSEDVMRAVADALGLSDDKANALENLADLADRNIPLEGHQERVAYVSRCLARSYNIFYEDGLPPEKVQRVARYHDVGKFFSDREILSKPQLSPFEIEHIRDHVKDGVLAVTKLEDDSLMIKGAGTHHERWDGKGYPHQIAGIQIPLIGRLIAVADTFDAIAGSVFDREYKGEQQGHGTPETAYEEIKRNMGAQFDPSLWEPFKAIFPEIKRHYNSLYAQKMVSVR